MHVVGGLSDFELMPMNADLSHAMYRPNPDMTSGAQIKTPFYYSIRRDEGRERRRDEI